MQSYTFESIYNKKHVQKNARRPLLYVAVNNTWTPLCLQCMTSPRNWGSSPDSAGRTASSSSSHSPAPSTECISHPPACQHTACSSTAEHTLTAGTGLSWLRPLLHAWGCLTWHPGALHILGLPDWTCNGNELSISNSFHMDHKFPMSCVYSLWCKKRREITSYTHSYYHKDQRAAAFPLSWETRALGFSEHEVC